MNKAIKIFLLEIISFETQNDGDWEEIDTN